eukprot:gene22258-26846_t
MAAKGSLEDLLDVDDGESDGYLTGGASAPRGLSENVSNCHLAVAAAKSNIVRHEAEAHDPRPIPTPEESQSKLVREHASSLDSDTSQAAPMGQRSAHSREDWTSVTETETETETDGGFLSEEAGGGSKTRSDLDQDVVEAKRRKNKERRRKRKGSDLHESGAEQASLQQRDEPSGDAPGGAERVEAEDATLEAIAEDTLHAELPVGRVECHVDVLPNNAAPSRSSMFGAHASGKQLRTEGEEGKVHSVGEADLAGKLQTAESRNREEAVLEPERGSNGRSA